MDKDDFRNMMGGEPKREETPEEKAAIEERLDSGDPTLGDVFSDTGMDRIFQNMEKRKQEILEHYKLNDAPDDDARHAEAMRGLLSKEQSTELRKAESAYIKRRFPMRDKNDATNSLLTFAATNPPEVLRRHVWRLQRDLDQPLFGTEMLHAHNRIRSYQAALIVELCDECADDLYEETKDSGAEEWYREPDLGRFHLLQRKKFYERSRETEYTGIYMFRYGDMYVERDESGSLFGDDKFPYAPPKACARCGINEAEQWRERFGGR